MCVRGASSSAHASCPASVSCPEMVASTHGFGSRSLSASCARLSMSLLLSRARVRSGVSREIMLSSPSN